jgi:Fe2+ or Zn2+ uptake regulation protein
VYPEEDIVRWTKQMKTIIDIVYASDVHLTADEIFLESKKTLPNISLGTVYRNLNRLSAQNMISIVPRGAVNTFSKPHDSSAYFECDRCHKLYRIPYSTFGLNVSDLSRKSGFRVGKTTLNMSGVCRECLKKMSVEGEPRPPVAVDMH